MKNINEISAEQFEQGVLHSNLPVLVDFYSPWCGPCKMLKRAIEPLAGEFARSVAFVKVNVDEAPQLADRYHIDTVPTLILFRDGGVYDTLVGLNSLRALKLRLQELSKVSESSVPREVTCHG